MKLTNLFNRFSTTIAIFLTSTQVFATVGQSVNFVRPESFAIGLDPELNFTQKASLGITARYTQGINDLVNAFGFVGNTNGERRFHVGGGATFDFFPDSARQPGLGAAFQATYIRLNGDQGGLFETTVTPYVHKSFQVNGNEIDPYFSFPLNRSFKSGKYTDSSHVVVGSLFEGIEHLKYTAEVGVAVANSDSYVAGGLVYYY